MNILKVINNKKNVLLNDSQTCAFLKHRITFSGTGEIPYIGSYANPTWEYLISQSQSYSVRAKGTKSSTALITIPIARRDSDEYYIYSVASASPLEMVSTGERMAVDTATGLKKPLFVCQIYAPYTTDIGSILRGLEIYVYSNKISKSETYGMEVFNEKGKPVFNSANYYIRAKDTLFKQYTEGATKADTLKETHTYEVNKLGLTVVNAVPGQYVGCDGSVVYAYPAASLPPNFFNITKYGSTLQYIVSELDQHKHFPESVDLAEV
jgi:hypothetical protein